MIAAQPATTAGTYADLKHLMKREGLFDPQPAYYTFKLLLTFGLLAISLALLGIFNRSWVQLLNAVLLAFVFGQIAFIGHDIGHRQVFRRRRWFELSGFLVGNLLAGWSWSWWVDKHNRHHAFPNESGTDPDIDVPMLAFSEEEARKKHGLLRVMTRYQAYLFVPVELLGWLAFLALSIGHLLRGKARYPLAEVAVMALHYALYWSLLLICLGGGQAIAFFVVHRALFGLYLGSVAAPNHKGMPVFERGNRPDFLHRQILSSRNVRAHPVTDFWYGGLNYQIEHHLFPTIPRNRLREVQKIVRQFCGDYDIAYHETGFLESYRETFRYLQQISEVLRSA